MMHNAKKSHNRSATGRTETAARHRGLQLALILLVAITVLLPRISQAADGAPSMPPMPVETLEVRIGTAEQQVAAVGSLQADESVTISAEIAGHVEAISFAEGTAGERGQLLIALDDAVLKAQLDQAEANLELHEADYRRAEALLADRAIAQQERDTAYAQWKLDQASVRLARAQWEKTRISAPFAGTLGLRQVSPGDYVQPGQPLVNLEDTRQLKVEFRVPERYAAQVGVGQRLRLQSAAFGDREFVAEVYAINPQVEVQSRSLVLRARLDNQQGLLRPGQFVRLQLTLAERENALFIPEQALMPQAQANLVFKVVDDKVDLVPVTIGQRQKGWVEVVTGLSTGDIVVTGGHQKIGPGSPVRSLPADPALFAAL